MLKNAFIPYRGYYSSPFSRWQGSFANENAIKLGAETSRRWFEQKQWDPKTIDYLFLGSTVHQPHGFYGGPWASAMMGADNIPGVLISQACSTSTISIYQAAIGVETGMYETAYCLMSDRCSNGPHSVWPNPGGPGGQLVSEDWVMDNFNCDPWAGGAMIQTAENVAGEAGITREECDSITLRRYAQYQDALADERAFQKRYMFPVQLKISRKKTITIEADEGVTETNAEGLEKLRPVMPDGVHTFGSQTHPADGQSAITVTTREKAAELSEDANVRIQVMSYGYARTKKAHMAMAVAPASKMALDKANIKASDLTAVKTHNPFASNDLYLVKSIGLDVETMNNYGSSLIFGHPQGPTVARLTMEGIEELALKGGGYLLVAGCAAGDTAAAIVLKVG